MRLFLSLPLALVAIAGAQPLPEEDFRVYNDHPRLLLTERRLRLLQREKQRESLRWQQFSALITGKAQMPEPGFSHALYYQVSEGAEHGREAVRWALTQNADIRQLALVYDWCQPILTPDQAQAIRAKLVASFESCRPAAGIPEVSSQVLAALAAAEAAPDLSARFLETVVRRWWREGLVRELKSGRRAVSRQEIYPLIEMLHAVRDNLRIELREGAARFFVSLPFHQLLSYYPSTFPGGENDFRIPAYLGDGQPDLRLAALSRAAELAMVALDTNSQESQFLQGWLIHDRFLLRGTFGIPYEFLWANPYQPGLSYHHVPLFFHEPNNGRLFLRSSWDEDAVWFGYFEGQAQVMEQGRIRVLDVKNRQQPVHVGHSSVLFGRAPLRFSINLEAPGWYFLVGLKPQTAFHLEVDDQEMAEVRSDRGGIVALEFKSPVKTGARLAERVN